MVRRRALGKVGSGHSAPANHFPPKKATQVQPALPDFQEEPDAWVSSAIS